MGPSRVRRCAAVALAVCFSAACGLSSQGRADAERASTLIDAENGYITRKKAAYQTFTASPAYAQYGTYADREAWAKQFDHARVKTAAARATYQRYVAPLLQRNDKEDEQALAVQVGRIARLVNEARSYADLPERRRGYVDEIAGTYARLARESADNAGKAGAAVGPLLALRNTTTSAFPDRSADIVKRVQPVQQLAEAAETANRKVSFEAAKAGAKGADWVVLGDNARLVSQNASKVREDARTVTDQLQGLSKSYSRTLADMKAEYFITVQRWAWNEDADSPPIHAYTYARRPLAAEAFDYFNSLPDSLPYAAKLSSSWFGADSRTHPTVDQARWASLGVAPREAWVPRDDTAEYGFALSTDYFHKYLTTENGQTQETDWQKVDETMFEEHVDDLGMDLLAKPFGAFEDEKVTKPTPTGLAFVGNPQYGHWQTDDRGSSFWAWYGAYRLFGDLLGAGGRPYYYRRDEWDTWSTRYRGQPYYGEDKDKKERYGTNGYVLGSSYRYATRIPDMRRTAVRHSGDAVAGRGGIHPAGK